MLTKFDPDTMASLGSSGAQQIATTHHNKINASSGHSLYMVEVTGSKPVSLKFTV
jgi:hypothetical protein